MSDIFFRVLRFVRKIVDSIGLVNVLLIAFFIWFLRSDLWLRLRVMLGLADEETRKLVEGKSREEKEALAREWSESEPEKSGGMDKFISDSKRDVAFRFYVQGCHDKGLISGAKWTLICLVPEWAVTDKMRRKYKYMYENNISESDYDSSLGSNGGHF